MSHLPSALSANYLPVLTTDGLVRFTKIYLNNMSAEECKSVKVSPMYNDLSGLGSALFLLGTEDALVDDSALMHFRWGRAGNEAMMRFVSGAPHGFMTFDGKSLKCTAEGWKIMIEYLNEKLG